MKHFLLIPLALLFSMPSIVLAQGAIYVELNVFDINPTQIPSGTHKQPIVPPSVSLDDIGISKHYRAFLLTKRASSWYAGILLVKYAHTIF